MSSQKLQNPYTRFYLNLSLYLIIPAITWLSILAIDLVTSNFFYLFLAILGISIASFVVSAIIKKNLGKRVLRDNRQLIQHFTMILLKALILASSVVALIAAFLSPEELMIFECNNTNVINLDYLLAYLVVYSLIYFITVLLTNLFTRR